jgi:AsmA protein
VLGIIVALFAVLALSLPLFISADQFRPALTARLSAALGREVTIGNLSASILAGGLTADSLAIADDPAFSRAPFLQAKSLRISVELWPLITAKKLIVTGLTVDQPHVILLQTPAGRWNYSTLGGAADAKPAATDSLGTLDLSAKLVRISQGRFALGQTNGSKPLVLENVNIEIRDFAPAAAFPFTLQAQLMGGGDIKLDGQAGPFDPSDLTLTPLTLKLNVSKLNLAAALLSTAPDIAGTAAFQATGASKAGKLTVQGKLKAEALKLAKGGTPARRPVELDFATYYDLRQHAGAVQRGDIHVGAAVASLTGTFADRKDSTVLDLKCAGTKMPVPELAELLPPLNVVLPNGAKLEGGTATVAFTVKGPADRISADGSVSLDKTRLAHFDLGTKMKVLQMLAGIQSSPNTDIEVLAAKIASTPAGSTVSDLRFIATGIGELSGAGTVSPTKALDFKMSATLQTSRSAMLSKTAVPFFIQGTAMDPVVKPDVAGLAKAQAGSLLQSDSAKKLKESVGGALGGLFGGKKK